MFSVYKGVLVLYGVFKGVLVIYSVFKGVLVICSVFKGVLVLYSVFKGVLVLHSVLKGVLVLYSVLKGDHSVPPTRSLPARPADRWPQKHLEAGPTARQSIPLASWRQCTKICRDGSIAFCRSAWGTRGRPPVFTDDQYMSLRLYGSAYI